MPFCRVALPAICEEITMTVSAIPDGYHALTPYLITENAAQAIEFYRKAFSAELVMQLPMPDGGVAHAELKIGDSHLMLSDMCLICTLKARNS